MNHLRAMVAAGLAIPYRLRFRRVGRRPRIRPPLLVVGGRQIELGDDVYIEPLVSLSATGGRLRIGSHCELRSFARVEADGGYLEVGDHSSINSFCSLNGYGGLRIGHHVRIASHTVILSSTHRFDDAGQPVLEQGIEPRETVVGDDVWFGSHCVVMGGVRIGSHTIVGAGAIVVDDIPPYSVAAGVPARVLRIRTPPE